MRTLVIGQSGQLARALAKLPEVVCVGSDIIDLAHATETDLEDAIRSSRCNAVINAAAYTAVDKAEGDPASAYALNQYGPRALAHACAKAKTPLVHVSTDYVFDGTKREPYTEQDPVAPLNVYGASKAAGESDVLQSGARAAIVRTSWVYDASGANFLNTMLRLAQTRDEVKVVSDQRGSPTWAADLAASCHAVAERLVEQNDDALGLVHFTGGGEASWADFAEAIFEHARQRGWPAASVTPIPASEYPTPAKRPQNSRLDTSRYAQLIAPPRDWREALALCVDEIARSKTAS